MLVGAFGEDAGWSARQRLLLERLRRIPQVSSAAIGGFPMRGTWTPPIIAAGQHGRTLASHASEDYFDTLGVALIRGRVFDRGATGGAERTAVISEATARRFWPNEDPLGKRFQLDMDFRGTLAEFEVIGVIRDVRFANLTRVDPAHVYLTGLTGPRAGAGGILLRLQGESRDALAAVRRTAGDFDPDLLPSLNLINVEDGPVRLQRSLARVYGMFALVLAALAVGLSGVGIYGVMSYLVSRRTKEIGIRIALGATRARVLGALVADGLRPVTIGIAGGLAGAAALSSVLHATLVFPGSLDLFYGVPFYDPGLFLGLACFIAGIAALASAVPARRAFRVDPVTALRHE
jgi:putative ABC transport system permease protein